MEQELVSGKIGEKGSYKAEFKGGKLVAGALLDTSVLDVELTVKLDAEPVVVLVIDKIKEAIPGTIDDALLEMAKKAVLDLIKK